MYSRFDSSTHCHSCRKLSSVICNPLRTRIYAAPRTYIQTARHVYTRWRMRIYVSATFVFGYFRCPPFRCYFSVNNL